MRQALHAAITALCCLGSCASAPAPDARPAHERCTLFQITKSENANYVVYDLLLDEHGGFAERPIDVYWVMNAGDGRREELTGIEQKVYGATVQDLDRAAGRLRMTVNGVGSRAIDVELPSADGGIDAYTTIDGRRARLTRIHLTVRPTWNPLSPDVEVRLTGLATPARTPQSVTEVIQG